MSCNEAGGVTHRGALTQWRPAPISNMILPAIGSPSTTRRASDEAPPVAIATAAACAERKRLRLHAAPDQRDEDLQGPCNGPWTAKAHLQDSNGEENMTRTCATRIAIAVSTFTCAALFSFARSGEHGVSISVDSAQARVGRPLTPVSVAGVARRTARRGAYGAAAVGTAAAIAATSPRRRIRIAGAQRRLPVRFLPSSRI